MKGMTALIVFLVIKAIQCLEEGVTPHELKNIKDVKSLAVFGDAAHRGAQWYDYNSKSVGDTGSDLISSLSSQTSSISGESGTISTSQSSGASSLETAENRLATRKYRVCTTCPFDMIKKYSNKGIKWICAGYQRARRSFKSDCMMRYRNCQDGTMFVKLYDRTCTDDAYHGRNWFYHYKV